MAHRANIDFDLYTGFTSNVSVSYEAYEILKASGIEFRHLHYNDPDAVPTMLRAIETWFPDEASLDVPFVTYVEAYDWNDEPGRILKLVLGIEAIRATDWAALKNFGA